MKNCGSNCQNITTIHYTNTWLGQTETWLYNQVRFLPSFIDSHVVCQNTENLDQFDLPNIHQPFTHSPLNKLWDKALKISGIRPYPGFLITKSLELGAQVLHSHYGHRGWANIIAAQKAGLRHIVTFYGLDVNFVHSLSSKWHDRYRYLFETVDRILCEGPHMAQCIVDQGCLPEKVKVHKLGIDLDAVPFRLREYSRGQVIKILIAGSFREKKGIPYAVEAVGKLNSSVPVELTIIGDANNEKRNQMEKKAILEILKRFRLLEKTRLLGYQPHAVLLEEALQHHIFLSPSVTASDGDTEGGAPVGIIEMSASGMPVVSTTHCDIPSVIRDKETGLLAPERDVNSLVDHLSWLVENPESWQSMALRARKHIETEYNCRLQGQKLAEIYEQVFQS